MPGLLELLQAMGVPQGALMPQQPGDIRGVPMAPGGSLMPEWLTALRDRNAAQPLGPNMRGYGPVPGGAMDQQESAAFSFPLAVEAFTPDRMGGPGNFANGPPAVTSLSGGPVPLPRARPGGADEVGGRSVTPTGEQPVGAPMSLAPQGPGPTMAGPGPAMGMPPMGGMGGGGGRGSGALLAALAGGFAGAPSFGSGMRRAFSNAAPLMAANEQRAEALDVQRQSQTDVIRAMQAKGVPNTEIMAALRNPVFMKEITDKYFGKQPEVKPPASREVKLANGMVQQQQFDPQKGWVPMPGHEKPVPGDKRDRALTVSDIEKLGAEGQKLAQVTSFHDTFKDKYGGFYTNTIGDAANTYGRHAPWASKNDTERAEWWQAYQMHKNEVRNKMFGSALTAPETAEWLKADITPGMRPDVIKTNLARQQKILETAIKRKADAAVKAGYPAESVYSAYGLDMPGKGPAGPSGKTRGGMSWSVVTETGRDEED